jgi:hypothetical protein
MGNLCAYTFDEKGSGTASSKLVRSIVKSEQQIPDVPDSTYLRSLLAIWNQGAASNNSQAASPSRFSHRTSDPVAYIDQLEAHIEQETERVIRPKLTLAEEEKTKHYYELKILPWKQVSYFYYFS